MALTPDTNTDVILERFKSAMKDLNSAAVALHAQGLDVAYDVNELNTIDSPSRYPYITATVKKELLG